MTKSKALYDFFNSFGITGYPINQVPDDTVFPWLTYENTIGNAGDSEISIQVNLWYRTDSEAIPNAKAEEISKAIGLGGKLITHDEGAIWVKRGTPWCNSLNDESDSAIKRRVLNIILEFI